MAYLIMSIPMALGDAAPRATDFECDPRRMATRPGPSQAVPDTVAGALWISEIPVESGALAGRSFLSGFDMQLADVQCAARPPFEIRNRAVLFGGRLGSPDVVAPAAAKGHVVVVLPPLRADGLPEHDVNRAATQLTEYRDAAAILVDALDLAPRRARESEPLHPAVRAAQCPPVLLVSHAVARVLLSKPPELAALGWNPCTRVSLKYQRPKGTR